MKKYLATFLTLAGLLTPTLFAHADITTGLISWQKLNGNVTDSTANGNNGTAIGSPTYITGNIWPQALSLNGTNQFVNVTENSGLPIYSSSGYSISGWFNFSTSNQVSLFTESQAGGSSAAGLFIYTLDGTDLHVYLRNNALTLMVNKSTFINTLPMNQWHQFVWTDNNGIANMYVDGVLDTANFNYTPSGTFTFSADEIGAACDSGCGSLGNMYQFMQGGMQEVRTYNRVLSQADVTQLYTYGSDILSNIIGHWNYDEGAGTTANDTSGNGNNGTLTGSTLPAWTTGIIGPYALNFNGSNQTVTVSNVSQEHSLTTATMCFWGNRSSSSNNLDVVFDDGSSHTRFGMEVAGVFGQIVWLAENGAGNFPHSSYSGTGAHLYCEVYDGSQATTSRITGYVDGVSQTISQNGAGNPPTLSSTTPVPLITGMAPQEGINSTGIIDEICLYSRPLTASDVTALFNSTTGCAAAAPTSPTYIFQNFATSILKIFGGASFSIY